MSSVKKIAFNPHLDLACPTWTPSKEVKPGERTLPAILTYRDKEKPLPPVVKGTPLGVRSSLDPQPSSVTLIKSSKITRKLPDTNPFPSNTSSQLSLDQSSLHNLLEKKTRIIDRLRTVLEEREGEIDGLRRELAMVKESNQKLMTIALESIRENKDKDKETMEATKRAWQGYERIVKEKERLESQLRAFQANMSEVSLEERAFNEQIDVLESHRHFNPEILNSVRITDKSKPSVQQSDTKREALRIADELSQPSASQDPLPHVSSLRESTLIPPAPLQSHPQGQGKTEGGGRDDHPRHTTRLFSQVPSKDSMVMIFRKNSFHYKSTVFLDTLRELCKNIQKSFDANMAEMIFFETYSMNIMMEVNPHMCTRLKDELNDKSPVFVIRTSHKNINPNAIERASDQGPSLSLHHFSSLITPLRIDKRILFKNGTLYVPILLTFGFEEPKPIGVLILSGIIQASKQTKSNSKFDRPVDEKEILAKMQNMSNLKELIHHLSSFFNILINDLKRHRAVMDADRVFRVARLFRFYPEINPGLHSLRVELPSILGFDEVCFLIKSNPNSDNLMALSPNASRETVASLKKMELFYFNPFKGFSYDCINNLTQTHVLFPRDNSNFCEGIDSLCPTVHLKNIIYVPLFTGDKQILGVMQLINKSQGMVTDSDLTLADMIGQIVGKGLEMMLTCVRMAYTHERVLDSIRMATKGYEAEKDK